MIELIFSWKLAAGSSQLKSEERKAKSVIANGERRIAKSGAAL
jgi:hypothetical protein